MLTLNRVDAMFARTASILALVATATHALQHTPPSRAPPSRAPPSRAPLARHATEILLVDHVNLNHEKGRHDLLHAFYFDFLGFAVDPRKAANVETGKKTLWANAGIHQLHLPEGEPRAQALDGRITVSYASLDHFTEARVERARDIMGGTKFDVRPSPDGYDVRDPWGTPFVVRAGDGFADDRGAQPGAPSVPAGFSDITLNVSPDADLAGVRRFYRDVMGVDEADANLYEDSLLILNVGPTTLTFVKKPFGKARHAELGVDEDGRPTNAGIHVSMYVADLGACYDRAAALGLGFVNYRFKRRALDRAEALDQCMFRVLDVVDPENPSAGPIVQVEHEIRSCVKPDGSKYKSCPLSEVP